MPIDPIGLEVLRTRLESLVAEAGRTIARTAISPVVVESGDFSATLLDHAGVLVAGGGNIEHHFRAATNFVEGILDRHGGTIADGDVFLANDPHNGGGLHAQDVFVGRPVVVDDAVVAWVASSAHMMDMGGVVPGSFAPAATECYAEAFRTPAVRLTRAGVEQEDIWAVLRTNVRVAELVEMDLRGLVAGVHVAHGQLREVVERLGVTEFEEAVGELRSRTAEEMGRHVAALEDGTYRASSWVEWNDELFRLVCTLSVEGSRLVFDFEGSAPQTDHFFNTKPYILEALLGVDLRDHLAPEVPFNGGLFDVMEIRCPEGSIVDCTPPAPIGAPHIYAGYRCVELAVDTLLKAAAASPGSVARALLNAGSVGSAASMVTWGGPGLTGEPDGWLMLDGGASGAPAANDRDGHDHYFATVGQGSVLEFQDVEVAESWYPIEFEYKRGRPDPGGAGAYRAGMATEMAYRVEGSPSLTGVTLGNHGRFPARGAAGGLPGSLLEYAIRRADGSLDRLAVLEQDVRLGPGEVFVLRCPQAGGWGDPLDRDPVLVEGDVAEGRCSPESASRIYGVVCGDGPGTESSRAAILRRRLAAADPPVRERSDRRDPAEAPMPLAPGVEQRGRVAVSSRSGAVLALAPDHWTDGCPVLRDLRDLLDLDEGLEARAYLDPGTGHIMELEVVPTGEPRSFASLPARWVAAGG